VSSKKICANCTHFRQLTSVTLLHGVSRHHVCINPRAFTEITNLVTGEIDWMWDGDTGVHRTQRYADVCGIEGYWHTPLKQPHTNNEFESTLLLAWFTPPIEQHVIKWFSPLIFSEEPQEQAQTFALPEGVVLEHMEKFKPSI